MNSLFLFNTFIFLAAACIAVPLASRFKLGSVLGYLIAGIAIGPFGLRLIGNPEQILQFAEFGVVMMLFVIGLELEPPVLWRLRRSIVGMGGVQVILTSAAFAGIGVALGYSWQMSLTVGMALSLSSTALVIQILQERNLMQTVVGETAFSILLFQDIAVIPILVLMPLIAGQSDATSPHAADWLSALPGWQHALVVAAVIAAVILTGRYLSRYLFYAIAKTRLREVFTATSLMLVIGITLLMQQVGISPALGAFVAGVVLANSEYRHTLETDIEPFKGLLLGLFFISVGMGMDFDLLADHSLSLVGCVVLLILVKAVLLLGVGRAFGLTPRYSTGLAVGLAQGGEFAFVLFQFAGGLEILPPDTAKFLTLVVALSIGITPLLVQLYSRYGIPKFMSTLPVRAFDVITEENPVIIAGFGRFGQVIGRFLMSQGVKITILEKDPDQIEALRKFNFKSYFGDAARADLLRSAGAAKAQLLVVAVDDADTCLEIVRMAKEEFPGLTIYARARNRRHAYELDQLGVDYFKRETFDSSLSMAQRIMVFLGRSEADMKIKAEKFLRHDEATLLKSFEFFDSEPELINFVKLQRVELERLLSDDMQEKVEA